ncbi:MAG: hypothetical protein LUO89_02795 [Methanothrix sp.]|nr:hypothetical protein [Methanothrix sp.]
MADNDNKELMDFLGKQFQGIEKQFERIDKRFEGIEKRLDNTASKDDLANFATKDDLTKLATKDDIEDVKRHTSVLIEALDHKIDIVIEGVMAANERLDRHAEENKQEHSSLEKRILINAADIAGLDQRVGRLESRA